MVLTTDPPVDAVTTPDATLEEKRLDAVERAEEKADEADSEGEDDALTMEVNRAYLSTRVHPWK